ncbi:hypothetical protein HDV00_006154 [Rhizophlyctis rosea]|nr:hypothetical protein HDV00_006154 [Rhizophlyctis rosea]
MSSPGGSTTGTPSTATRDPPPTTTTTDTPPPPTTTTRPPPTTTDSPPTTTTRPPTTTDAPPPTTTTNAPPPPTTTSAPNPTTDAPTTTRGGGQTTISDDNQQTTTNGGRTTNTSTRGGVLPTSSASPSPSPGQRVDGISDDSTSSGLSPAGVTGIAVAAVCIILAVVGIYIFRKLKLKPSSEFKSRVNLLYGNRDSNPTNPPSSVTTSQNRASLLAFRDIDPAAGATTPPFVPIRSGYTPEPYYAQPGQAVYHDPNVSYEMYDYPTQGGQYVHDPATGLTTFVVDAGVDGYKSGGLGYEGFNGGQQGYAYGGGSQVGSSVGGGAPGVPVSGTGTLNRNQEGLAVPSPVPGGRTSR